MRQIPSHSYGVSPASCYLVVVIVMTSPSGNCLYGGGGGQKCPEEMRNSTRIRLSLVVVATSVTCHPTQVNTPHFNPSQ